MEKAYGELDKEDKGFLTYNELADKFLALGATLSRGELISLAADIDTDDDEKISKVLALVLVVFKRTKCDGVIRTEDTAVYASKLVDVSNLLALATTSGSCHSFWDVFAGRNQKRTPLSLFRHPSVVSAEPSRPLDSTLNGVPLRLITLLQLSSLIVSFFLCTRVFDSSSWFLIGILARRNSSGRSELRIGEGAQEGKA